MWERSITLLIVQREKGLREVKMTCSWLLSPPSQNLNTKLLTHKLIALYTPYHTCPCLCICSICHHVPLNPSWMSSLAPYFYWSLELGENWNQWRSRNRFMESVVVEAGTGWMRPWAGLYLLKALQLVLSCVMGDLPLWAMTWGRVQYFQPVCL